MTPRRWGVGGWLVAAAAGLVAAGGLVGLLVWDRRLFLLAVGWMCSLYLAYRIPNRNLLAELANRDASIDAWNLSAKRTDLDQVGTVSPPAGTRSVEVEWLGPTERPFVPIPLDDDPEPPEWMDQSGYRPPNLGRTYSLDEVMAEHGITQADLDAIPDDEWVDISDSVQSIEITPGRPPAANGLHVSRGWGDDPFAPGCGCLIAHCGLVIPQAGCAQHDNGKSFRQAHRVEECPVYSGCPFAECPHPGNCTGECRWNIDQPDLDASDGPRSLPQGRID